MQHAHLPELIHQAAAVIEGNADSLRECHSFNGAWAITHPADEYAQASYERDQQLVVDLRAALTELSACHQTCAGLTQILQAHRLNGAAITYAALAELLPEGQHA